MAAAISSALNDYTHAEAFISSVVQNSPKPLLDEAATKKVGVRRLRAKLKSLMLEGFVYWLLGLKEPVLMGSCGVPDEGEGEEGAEGEGAVSDGPSPSREARLGGRPAGKRKGGGRTRAKGRKAGVVRNAGVHKPRRVRARPAVSDSEESGGGGGGSSDGEGISRGGEGARKGRMHRLRPRTGPLAVTTRHAQEIAQSDEVRSKATGGFMAPDDEYLPSESSEGSKGGSDAS